MKIAKSISVTNSNLQLSLLHIYTSEVFLNLGVLALPAVFLKYWTMAVRY